VLVDARNPLNIGAAARAMSNFGFRRLRVVNHYRLAFREARSAVGAPELLREAEECRDVPEAITDCSFVVGTTAAEARRIEHPLHRLEAGAEMIRTCTASGSHCALLFGSEKRGLSNSDISFCHCLMRIPTREEHSSMNLGQAVAVCLYELIRGDAPAAIEDTAPHATGEELARMEQELLKCLLLSGYTKPGAEAATEERVRKLLRRMQLSSEDARTWTGMLAKMQLRQRKDSRT